MYKETNGAWIIFGIFAINVIFVCVSVDQALISNKKGVKNLKLSDLLSKRVSITLINFKS